METKGVSEFWLRKEEELRSRLLIRCVATYIAGYPELNGPVLGLLYLMENGFYFENFEKRSMWVSMFQKNDSFKKVFLKMPIGSITEVYCFCQGLSEQGIARKFINIFRKKSEGIVIKAFLEDRQEILVSFECLENPRKIQEEYGKLIEGFRSITNLPK
jgi:hypothetical protein